jgi:hypothetical protein
MNEHEWSHPVEEVFFDLFQLVSSKSEDYADEGDPFTNFTGSAYLANVTDEQVFNVLIGIKVERLRQLTSGKEPNHEGIEDTLMDLANYAALWIAFRRREAAKEQIFLPSFNLTGLDEPVKMTVVPDDVDWVAHLGED